MNNLKILQECLKYPDYSPYCAYGEYEGIYDEAGHSINAIGVNTDNEIVMSSDYKDLIRKDHCTSNVTFFISGKCYTISDLINHIDYIDGKCKEQFPIKIKGNDGKIYNIEDIVIDTKCKRVVFIADYKIK